MSIAAPAQLPDPGYRLALITTVIEDCWELSGPGVDPDDDPAPYLSARGSSVAHAQHWAANTIVHDGYMVRDWHRCGARNNTYRPAVTAWVYLLTAAPTQGNPFTAIYQYRAFADVKSQLEADVTLLRLPAVNNQGNVTDPHDCVYLHLSGYPQLTITRVAIPCAQPDLSAE